MQDSDSESFDLPDWGTEGAPPQPPLTTDTEPSEQAADLILDVTPDGHIDKKVEEERREGNETDLLSNAAPTE